MLCKYLKRISDDDSFFLYENSVYYQDEDVFSANISLFTTISSLSLEMMKCSGEIIWKTEFLSYDFICQVDLNFTIRVKRLMNS